MKVKLKDIADALQMQMDEASNYLNIKSGNLLFISNEEFGLAEDMDQEGLDDVPNWQKDTIVLAREVLNSDDYLALPSKYEIHDYGIMQDFAYAKDSDELLNAIRGSGAFRYFKDTVYRLDLVDEWYAFREAAYLEKARHWCKINEIDFE